MPVDPTEDVDICITCLTKTPPKLPLREELPSLGVELIYKARGTGANLSKREAKRAAKDFRYTESFKDIKKRRLFPKSSKRIRDILEERRVRESEIRHVSSAVSYESYRSELYGDWVTDTSSSTQSKSSSSSSSTASSVSEINTTRNRRMTKSALKRWRLFRKQSNRRKEKLNRKQQEKKSKIKNSETNCTTGFLIGDDVFADFLAPVPHVNAEEEDEDLTPSIDNAKPSWYPDSTRRKTGNAERKQSTGKLVYPIQSKPSQQSSYFDDDDFPPVGLGDDSPLSPFDSNSPTPSSQLYPNAKSPPPTAYLMTPTGNRTGKSTPTTMATTPGRSMSPEMESVASSVTFSQKQSRREKLLGGNSKLSRYLSQRKNRPEVAGSPPIIQESKSQESASDTSLIGLSVAFPKDDSALESPNPDIVLSLKDSTKAVDAYVSDDTDSREEEEEEDSGVFEAQTSSLNMTPNKASTDLFEDIPEDLYQAFGRQENPSSPTKHLQHEILVSGTVVEDTCEMGSYRPIVPGTDIQTENETTTLAHTPKERAELQAVYSAQDSSQEPEKPKKENMTFKWLNGGIQKIKSFGSKKTEAEHGPGEANTDSKLVENSIEMATTLMKAPSDETSELNTPGSGQQNPKFNHAEFAFQTQSRSKTEISAQSNSGPRLDDSTALAFSNIPDEFYRILSRGNAEQRKIPPRSAEDDDDRSLQYIVKGKHLMLTQYDTELGVVKRMIAEDPTLAQIKDREDGQMLLHCLASSPFPPHIDSEGFLDLLLDDIHIFHEKLKLIYEAFPAASEVVDSDGDLPVHLLARNLMHWETTWYAKVYEQALKESENPIPGGPATAAITTLYYTMSRCIETMLKRVVVDKNLCQERGSVGSLLPLHIATIFTVTVATLRQALEAYPVGAVECVSVKGFNWFVPDGSLPIEIHESFCTDFPKWEVEVSGTNEVKWSQSRDVGRSSLEDSIRRSDLLFAYNPSIQRFWDNKARIRRIECRLNFEAKRVPEIGCERITKASERMWVWMCTFTKGDGAVFMESVERILEDLPSSLVRLLATIPAPNGEAIVDVAHPDCVTVIRDRLDNLSESITPIVTTSGSSSRVLQSWDETMSSKLSQAGKVNLGQVCRAIFNIKEKEIPTSFVILPYKLARNANGTLGMSSVESAPLAVKFADCLLKLTDPRSILYFLDKKSESYFGVSMYEGAEDAVARAKAFSHVAEFEKALLDLYASRVAYLYLLDEETGVPLVPVSDHLYPMVLHEPVSMVRKLLPMMTMGMVQMRGDKAISVASTILLDNTIGVLPSHYEHAAKKMSVFLRRPSNHGEQQEEEMAFVKSELNRFLSSFRHKRQRDEETLTGTTEWNVELSIIRMLFEVNDPKGMFSGLVKEEVTDEEVRWIFDENFQTCSSNRKEGPPARLITDKKSGDSRGSDSASQSSDQDSYETFGADPLKFHQPPDDATETTYDTQGTANLNTTGETASPNLMSGTYVGLAPTTSDDSTESERLRSKNSLLMGTFGAKAIGCSNYKGNKEHHIWNPAEQIWVDVHNRLDVTGFFWDEAQVTSLRVDLLQQANKLCSLQKRIGDIKKEENEHARRVEELFCQIMGDNGHVLEVPSPRSLFGARRLLARLNELETRLLESEVGSQHLSMGVATLNEEIIDLIPLLEEELSSASSSSSSIGSTESSPDIQSYVSYSDGSAISGILSDVDSSEIASASIRNKIDDSFKSSSERGGWTASTSIERIRKAFAAARRGDATYHHSPRPSSDKRQRAPLTLEPQTSLDSSASNHEGTKLSTLTDSRSSLLRERAAAARSRASQEAAGETKFPFEIALPMLDHRDGANTKDSSSSDEANSSLLQKANTIKNESSSSSSSFSFENTSVVQYDKETGRIEF